MRLLEVSHEAGNGCLGLRRLVQQNLPKRRVQEILEDDDDLVPLKKRYASVKSIEMAKAVN